MSWSTAIWAASLAGCGPSSDQGVVAEVCGVDLVSVVELGSIEDSISITSTRVDVTRLRDGSWLVVEPSLRTLLHYAADGTLIRRFGTRGAGPGEFLQPEFALLDGFDSLWVSDGRQGMMIFDPDGHYARAVRGFYRDLEGFTPSGWPYEILVKFGGAADVTPEPYLVVWDRAGDSLFAIGPGVRGPFVDNRSVQIRGRHGAAVADSTFWISAFSAPGVWLTEWKPQGERDLLFRADGWKALRALGIEAPLDSGLVSAVGTDGAGGAWVAGRFRTVSEADAARIAAEGDDPRSPPVMVRTYDGFVLHFGVDARVSAAGTFDDPPSGFVDAEHLFSIAEDEATGFLSIRVWKIEERCG